MQNAFDGPSKVDGRGTRCDELASGLHEFTQGSARQDHGISSSDAQERGSPDGQASDGADYGIDSPAFKVTLPVGKQSLIEDE